VMFIYREEYYLSRSMPDMVDHGKFAEWQERMDRSMNVAEVIVSKQRHGSIGPVKLHFAADVTRFSDLDQAHSPD